MFMVCDIVLGKIYFFLAYSLCYHSNCVHRDLAARNVMVHRQESGEMLAKIADFGLSRSVYPCVCQYIIVHISKTLCMSVYPCVCQYITVHISKTLCTSVYLCACNQILYIVCILVHVSIFLCTSVYLCAYNQVVHSCIC